MNRPETTPRSFTIDQLHAALGEVGGPARPDYLADIVAQAGRSRQRPGWTFPDQWLSVRGVPRTAVLFATLLLLVLLAATLYVGSRRTPPPVDLGIFEPVVGRIVYEGKSSISGLQAGMWGLDPAATDPAAAVRLTSEPGNPLAWSRDGTRLLFQKNAENLFLLHADGSETQVTERLRGIGGIPGSSRPAGATISPDGSRVIFAGLTTIQSSCHDGALFAVGAAGGPADLLWKSHVPQNGIVRYPTFSPDGARIAFADGYCDSSHSVWVMNADGTDARQIVVAEDVGLGAGHVYGLEWSPRGDRIALQFEGSIYTFAPDGSDFTRVGGPGVSWRAEPHWSPDGTRIAYTTGCDSANADEQVLGCVLEIADADGSNVQQISDRISGPWHPGRVSPTVEPTVPPSTSAEPSSTTSRMWPQTSLAELREAQRVADAGDGRYTWQYLVDELQLAQHHPKDALIFVRFLREVLGWEDFRWDEAFAHPDGLVDGDVVYVRCAPGEINPLYPDDPKGGCAPTLDEFRYETVKIKVAQLERQGPRGIWVVTSWEMIEPAKQIRPPSATEISASVDAFLQARIDGHGAEDLASLDTSDPFAEERVGNGIPLLYATSSGAPYERAEFEVEDGPVWPSGKTPVVVRLFAGAGETVVEQRYFAEPDGAGRLHLVFNPWLAGSSLENGDAVPAEYGFLDGMVTYRAADPLGPSQDGYRDRDRLAIAGTLPDDDVSRRVLLMLADPRPIGPGCVEVPAPADAQALAGRIRSDPDFEATAPVAVTIGGVPALQMDVRLAPGAEPCPWSEAEMSGTSPLLLTHARFAPGSDRARVYLLDLPGGSAKVLALVTITDEDSFETVLKAAKPVVDSIEFHTP